MLTLSPERHHHMRVEMLREKLDSFAISDYHGLNSPGMTCYLNSVLQVLFMTEDFREAVKGCCGKDSTTIDAHLGRLFANLQKRVARTDNIINKLGITNVYEERDAAEYFEKILSLTSPEATEMFRGELNHKATCRKCEEKNDSTSSFWVLPLAVEDSCCQTSSVEKGLKALFSGEKVCRDNKMYCRRCNQKRDADFGCEITQSPEILTLLLRRFTFDYMRGCYVKLHNEVEIPQTLYMENCEYDLYALVHHLGTLTGGHYTAQIKSFETQGWYYFNDDIVEGFKQAPFGAGDKSLSSCTAYLLMYRKVSRHPEKGNQEACCAPSHVEADESEREEAFVPDYQQMDESCSSRENLKQSNGGVLKRETFWKKTPKIPLWSSITNSQTGNSCFPKMKKDRRHKSHEPARQTKEYMCELNTARCHATLKVIEPGRDSQMKTVAKTGSSVTDCWTRSRVKPAADREDMHHYVAKGERSRRAKRNAARSTDKVKPDPWRF